MRTILAVMGMICALLFMGSYPALAQDMGLEVPSERLSESTSEPQEAASLATQEPESPDTSTSVEVTEPVDADAEEESEPSEAECDDRANGASDECAEEVSADDTDDTDNSIGGKIADSTIDKFSKAAVKSAGDLLKILVGWWILIPSPALQDASGLYEVINGHTRDVQVVLLIASLMIVALRIAMARRGMIEGTVYETTGSFIKIIIASAVWVPLIMMLMHAGDLFSNQVLGEGAQEAIDEFIIASRATTGFLPLMVAVFSIFTGLAQVMLLFVRAALLILVAAVIPLAAAAGGTSTGRETYQRLQSWTIALLLFKPAGALVYAIAFLAIDKIADLEGLIVGFLLFGMAVLTLPALLALIAPNVDSIGTGPSGVGMAGSIAKAGGMAAAGVGVPGAAMKFAGGASSFMGSSGGSAAGGGGSPGAGGAGPAEFSSAGSKGGAASGAGGAGLTSGAQEAGTAGSTGGMAAGGAGGMAAGAATGGISTAVGAAAGAVSTASDAISNTVNAAAGTGGSSAGSGPASMSSSPAPGSAPIDQLSSNQTGGNGFTR